MTQETQEKQSENTQQNLQQKTLADKLSEIVSHGGVKGLAKGLFAGTAVGGTVLGIGYSLDTPLDGFFYVATSVSSLATGGLVFLYESRKEQARYFGKRLQQARKVLEFREYVNQGQKVLEEKVV